MGFALRIASIIAVLLIFVSASAAADIASGAPEPEAYQTPFWVWPLLLLVVSFLIGVVAIPAGIGGGVLFVPIVSSFFPFHLDFVRCAALLTALAASVAAGPRLLRSGSASLRALLPVALVTSSFSIVGAMIGLALPSHVIRILLGVVILGIVVLMLLARRTEFPHVPKSDWLSQAMRIHGLYRADPLAEPVEWRLHRTPLGLALFVIVGLLAGMFGLGAGWANVPVLNLVMGMPLKTAVGTSVTLLAVTDSSAAWIYINNGAVIPMIVVPSVVGMMLGSRVGVKLFHRLKPAAIRYVVLVVLTLAGARSLLDGLGVM